MQGTNMPVANRFERKKQEMKQNIIDVSMKLFVSQGVNETTMEQIAEEVDIAKGTLYNYFPAKEAIIDEYIRQSFVKRNPDRVARLQTLPDTRARMVALLNELMEGVRAQKDIFEKYFIYRIQKMIALQTDESATSGLYALEREVIRLGQEASEIRDDLSMQLLTGLFEFVFIKVAQQFYQDPDALKDGSMIEQSVDIFMNGAGA